MKSEPSARAAWLRAVAIAACCLVCLGLASCGLPLTGTGGGAPDVRAGDAQNGATVTVHAGQTLMVTLASTYWSFQGSSDAQVLAPVGNIDTSPQACSIPGCGAGTVSQEYRAVGPGTAQVTASRVSCGEAVRCTGASGSYQLTVQVTDTSQ